jgi:hypothetical protein
MFLSTSDNHVKLQKVAEEFKMYLEQREIGKDYERTLRIYNGQIDPTFIRAFESFKDRHRVTVERYPDFPRRAEEFEEALSE